MYASEKYVKMEAKELNQRLSDLANDLGGDIRFLHQEITEIASRLQNLEEQLRHLGDNDES